MVTLNLLSHYINICIATLGRLSIKDFFDITIISVLVFAVFVVFKKTRSLPIVFGILALAILYVLSIVFDLQLTHTVFSTFFGMFLVVIAIVFQKELKRLFEFFGQIGISTIRAPHEETIKIIIHAVQVLSKEKTGALIAFAGKENLKRHLEGGIKLNGEVSLPILLSIFNSKTPGHDGAVIIENNVIRRFAVHFPLSESRKVIGKYGTRHRAAIGLSELTDALILVVSEETGRISIAHNKKLTKVDGINKLEKILEDFFQRKFPRNQGDFYIGWLKRNILPLVFSVLITLFFWVFLNFQNSMIQRKFTIPIQFEGLQNEYVVENYTPENAVVVLSGKETEFNLLKSESLQISVNLKNMKNGHYQMHLRENQIKKPANLSIVNIEPANISVDVEKLKVTEQQLDKTTGSN